MTTDLFSIGNIKPRRRFSWRWVGLVAASILLHAAFVDWANGRLGPPQSGEPDRALVTAQLKAEQAVHEAPPAPKPSAPPKRKKPRLHPVPAPAPRTVADRSPVETLPPPLDPSLIGMAAPGSSVEIAAAAPAPEPVAEPPAAAPEAIASNEPPKPAYKVVPPPSAELKYDVRALREGQTVYGHGKLSWQSDGSRYNAGGEAGVLFFTVLTFKSEGEINDFGVAPILYNEKRFRKSATNTHFHRERNTISFSASETSYPRSGGEQDRATVIWQLAGIGRGDSAKFSPGAEIDLFVAGVRDAETWRIQVVGEEEIEIGGGKASAWHVSRAPRAGSYDQRIDIWFAPHKEWYPVKVRYTETNGDYLELSLSSVTLAAVH